LTLTLLLYAEPLAAEGLTRLLQAERPGCRVRDGRRDREGPLPQLVLWQPEVRIEPLALLLECQRLQERWQPAPLLLLLTPGHRLSRQQLLALPAMGVLEAPTPERLLAAISTLEGGGRVLELATAGPVSDAEAARARAGVGLGLGQWLLLSGLQQIEVERALCQRLLVPPPGPLTRLVLEGRLRELAMARQLLLWLWGPVSLAWGEAATDAPHAPNASPASGALTLPQRSAESIWSTIEARLQGAVEAGVANGSGQLLAIEGLAPQRRADLLLALMQQLTLLRQKLAQDPELQMGLAEHWQRLQPELRRQALRAMASPYVQLPLDGSLQPVADTLLRSSDLDTPPGDLPDPEPLLAALVQGRPLLVDGQLVAPDEPRAVLHLEQLVANWLLRSAEQIAAELLACCSGWPELRRYLLRPELLATRNLERLRNQLNAQNRWSLWFERPVELYESRRTLLSLSDGRIEPITLTEPRDGELRQLGWLPQLVTLALETRDALGPQLRRLVKGLGDLVVVVLTQVVGRAIGLVGRGVVQGMGRSLSKG
jgi:hypothetical protein